MYEMGHLTHHGILGMKWGVRRYQNKDGTLTAAGRKRLRKLEKKQAKLDKKMNDAGLVREKAKANEAEEAHKTQIKSIHDMSDQDLQATINRMRNEKALQDLMKERYLAENPPPKQKEALVNGRKVVGDILTSALADRGKDIASYGLGTLLNKAGKEMGLKEDISSKGYRYIEKAKEAEKQRKERAEKEATERRQKEIVKYIRNMKPEELNDEFSRLTKESKVMEMLMKRNDWWRMK